MGPRKVRKLSNEERTKEYFANFSREKVLRRLVQKTDPLIIDIGANMGQSVEEFSSVWPESKIIAFEPQSECVVHLNKLKNQFSSGDLEVVETAVGNTTNYEGLTFYSHNITSGVTGYSSGLSGFNRFNVNSNDSINLQSMDRESDEYLQYVKNLNHERKVPCIRLDDYLENAQLERVDLLKIDTQGFEPEVLEGAGKYLKSTKVVLTELMFFDLYERSLSFSDIEKFLLPAGFELFDISHISRNPSNGRTDWVDVVYLNKEL